MDAIPWGALGNLTPYGAVMLAVLMLYFGKLVPAERLKREQELSDKWETAYNRKVEAVAQKDAIIEQLTETNHLLTSGVGETMAKLLAELQQKAGDRT